MKNLEANKSWGYSAKPWMVKTGGRVVGPLTSDEIISKLRGKEFVALDEITNCFGRWHYIRDERTFDTILNELKNRSEGADPSTDSMSNTQTQTDLIETTEVSQFRRHDRLVEGVDEQIKRPEDATDAGGVKTYGLEGDARVQAEVAKMGGQTWIWAICLLLSVGIVWGVLKSKKTTTELLSDNPQLLLTQAMSLERLGEFKKAKERLEHTVHLSPLNLDAKLLLAPILLWDGDTVGAKRIAEEVLQAVDKDTSTEPAQLAERAATARTILGVAGLVSQDSILAENSLKEALAKKADFQPALFNNAVLQLRISNYSVARGLFEGLLGKSKSMPLAALGLGDAVLKEEDKTLYEPALLKVQEQLARTNDYRQELTLLRAVLLSRLDKGREAEALVLAILDIDPDETQDHVHDPMYMDEYSNWAIEKKWAIELKENLENSPYVQTLLGYATYRSGDRAEGKHILEGALQSKPNDPSILGVKAFMLMRSGLKEDVEVTLSLANQESKRALPLLLKAKACIDDDKNACARESYVDALKADGRSLRAMAGLASLSRQGGDSTTFSGSVESGLAISPNYKPLLALQQLMQSKAEKPGNE